MDLLNLFFIRFFKLRLFGRGKKPQKAKINGSRGIFDSWKGNKTWESTLDCQKLIEKNVINKTIVRESDQIGTAVKSTRRTNLTWY